MVLQKGNDLPENQRGSPAIISMPEKPLKYAAFRAVTARNPSFLLVFATRICMNIYLTMDCQKPRGSSKRRREYSSRSTAVRANRMARALYSC